MMLPRHNYRSPEVSQEEARLTHEMQNASPEIQDVSNKLQNTETDLDALQDAINAHRITPEAAPLVPSVAQELNRQRDPEIKKKLRALSERAFEANKGALKKTIDDIDAEVVAPSTTNAETNLAKQTSEAPTTFVDKTKDVVKTIGKSLGDAGEQMTNAVLPKSITKDMSRNKKIAIAAAGTAVVGLVAWYLFGRAKNAATQGADAAQKTEGGFFRKWLVRIGVTAGVLFGLKMLADRYLPTGTIDDVKKTAKEAAQGAEKGITDSLEILGPAAKEMLNHEHTSKVLSERKKYSELEFSGALLGAIVKDGYDLVVDETGIAIYAGGKLIPLTGKFGEQAYDYFYNQNMTVETTGDLLATYVQGTLVFASSLTALKLITFNKIGKNANMLLEAGLWPIYTVKRGAQGGFTLLRGMGELANSNSATRLNMRRMDSALSRNIRLPFKRTFFKKDALGLLDRFEFAQDQLRLLESARTSRVGSNAEAMKLFEDNFDLAVDEFKFYASAMKAEDIPEQFRTALAAITDNTDLTRMTRDQYKDILKKMGGKTKNNPVATNTTSAADEIADITADASKAANTTDESVDLATKTNSTVADIATEGGAVEIKGQGAVNATDANPSLVRNTVADSVSDSAQARQLETMVATIAESDPEGAKALQTLLDSASTESRIQILNTPTTKVPKLGAFAKTCVALGIIGDVFSVWTGYLEHLETQEAIKNTSNTELQNMYKKRYMYIGSNVTIGTVGLGTGIASLCGVQASTTGPISLATIPLTLAVGGLYSEHEWEVSKSMDPNDIARTYAPEDIIAMLSYTPFWEKVGKTVADTNMDTQEAIDQKHLNLMRITALARSTTTVSMPTKIYDHQTYTERPLREDEQKLYGGALQTYLNAKISYLEKHAKGITNERYISEPFANTDMGKLLMESDQYAKLMHDRFVLSQQTENPESKKALESLPLATLSEEDQIREYQHTKLKNSISSLMLFGGNTKESSEGEYVLSQCENVLAESIQPYMLAMHANIKREDTNFKTLWSDGNAGELVLQHAMTTVDTRIKQQSSALSEKILQWETLKPNPVSEDAKNNDVMREFVVDILAKQLEVDIAELQTTLSRPVTEWWADISDDEKRSAEIKITATQEAAKITAKMQEVQKAPLKTKEGEDESPFAIASKMKNMTLELQLYRQQRTIDPSLEPQSLMLKKLVRGTGAIKNIMRPHDVSWDEEQSICWVDLFNGRSDGHENHIKMRIFFNPMNEKWEWNASDGKILQRINPNDPTNKSMGNSPGPLPSNKESNQEKISRLTTVMQTLNDINKITK